MTARLFILLVCCFVAGATVRAQSTVTYVPTDSLFPNPERGFYSHLEVQTVGQPLTLTDLLNSRNCKGQSLILRMYYLKKFRATDLSAAQLNLIETDFNRMRQAGVKCVLRFAYSSFETDPDAPLCTVLLLLLSWPILVNKVFPPKPLPPGQTNVPTAVVTGTNLPPTIGTSPAPLAVEAPVLRPAPISPSVPEQVLEFTNANAHYTFSSHGGGLEFVELLKYPESVSRRDRRAGSRRVAALNSFAPVPTLTLLDGDAVQGDGIYALTRTPKGIRAEKTLTNGLTITKDFEVSTNYLVLASVRLQNRSDKPLSLPSQEWFVGTAAPMNSQDDGSSLNLMWYNGSSVEDIVGASHFSDKSFACTPRVPPPEYRGGQDNVVWAAMHNQFFALAVMPKQPAQQVVMRKLQLPIYTHCQKINFFMDFTSSKSKNYFGNW